MSFNAISANTNIDSAEFHPVAIWGDARDLSEEELSLIGGGGFWDRVKGAAKGAIYVGGAASLLLGPEAAPGGIIGGAIWGIKHPHSFD